MRHFLSEKRIADFFCSISASNNCYWSSNCLGGRFYKLEKRLYTSPTVGMYMKPNDFLQLTSQLKTLSKIDIGNLLLELSSEGHPVGSLLNSTIYFQHYSDFESAKLSFVRRLKRIQLDNLFVVMTDRDGFEAEHFSIFQNLPFARKVLFTSNVSYKGQDNCIYIPGFKESVPDLYTEYWRLGRKSVITPLSNILSFSD